MRVCLRDRRTHLYYAGPNHWTSAAAHAFDFTTLEQAFQASRQALLAEAEIVFLIPTSQLEPTPSPAQPKSKDRLS